MQSNKLVNKSIDEYIRYKYLMSLLFNPNGYSNGEKLDKNDVKDIFELISSIVCQYKEIPPIVLQNFNMIIDSTLNLYKDESIISKFMFAKYLVDTSIVGISLKFIDASRKELCIRRSSKKYLFCTEEEIMFEIDAINKSIFNDYQVLFSHLETNIEDFEDIWVPYFINNPLYLESINSILTDCPELFLDKTFYSRVVNLLNLNYKLSVNKEFKMLQKKMMNSIQSNIKNRVN